MNRRGEFLPSKYQQAIKFQCIRFAESSSSHMFQNVTNWNWFQFLQLALSLSWGAWIERDSMSQRLRQSTKKAVKYLVPTVEAFSKCFFTDRQYASPEIPCSVMSISFEAFCRIWTSTEWLWSAYLVSHPPTCHANDDAVINVSLQWH